MEIFKFVAKEGVAILFSTHITSDLEKCADDITYIRKGKLEFTGSMSSYIQQCAESGIGSNLEEIMIHFEKEAFYEKIND